MDSLVEKLQTFTREDELAEVDVDNLTPNHVIAAVRDQIYGRLDYTPSKKYALVRYTNVEKRYIETTSLISAIKFNYHELERYNPVDMSEDELRDFKEKAKRFLDSAYQFHPDYHVTSLEKMSNKSGDGDDPVISNAPVNVFYNFASFCNAKKEEHGKLAEQYFGLSRYLDLALNILEVFDTEDQVIKFLKTHREQLIKLGLDAGTVELNQWVNLQEATKCSTAGLDDNNPIKAILEQLEKDRQLGEAIVDKRVEKLKVVEAKKVGPMDPTAKAKAKSVFAIETKDREYTDLAAKEIDPFLPKEGTQIARQITIPAEQKIPLPQGVVEVPIHTFDTNNNIYKQDKIYSDFREDD